jgi:DnaJ-class molecular chaperone
MRQYDDDYAAEIQAKKCAAILAGWAECPDCHGTGYADWGDGYCLDCGGTGHYMLDVPAGDDDE